MFFVAASIYLKAGVINLIDNPRKRPIKPNVVIGILNIILNDTISPTEITEPGIA